MDDAPTDRVASIDLRALNHFADIAMGALRAAREEIDALNVYPVPDGDTGTNMYLTFEAARQQMIDGGPDLRVALAGFARGALLGARGNSGVILAQLVGAVCRRLAAAGPEERAAAVFADALTLATEAGYAAVGTPVEGTILSVARAASEAATACAADESRRLGHVLRAAAVAARDALDRTPDQLPVLRDADVVDAGGRGLCVVLDAAETAATGKRPVPDSRRPGARAIPIPIGSGDLREGGPAYEVMFLLDADDDAVPGLRRALAPLGDSLVVIGGEGLWNVHVHVDDVGSAVEAGIAAGRPHRIKVTHFAEQLGAPRPSPLKGRRVVVVAAGAGLAELFAAEGAVVVRPGDGRRTSTGELLDAIRRTEAEELVILPNDRDSLAVAEAAAQAARDEDGRRVRVIATSAQVQGLAALAVHEPGRPYEQDVLEMTAAARHARSGAVTVASRRAITMAGPCEPGDTLGVVEGDFAVVGHDLYDTAVVVLERLLGGGGEMVTLVTGQDADGLGERCAAYLAAVHPTVDVALYEGGQPRYPLLMGVE